MSALPEALDPHRILPEVLDLPRLLPEVLDLPRLLPDLTWTAARGTSPTRLSSSALPEVLNLPWTAT